MKIQTRCTIHHLDYEYDFNLSEMGKLRCPECIKGTVPEQTVGLHCLCGDPSKICHGIAVSSIEEKIQAAKLEVFNISDAAILRLGIVASELATRQNDQEAANIIQDIINKYDELKDKYQPAQGESKGDK